MGQAFTRFDEQQESCFKLNFREPVKHFPLILIYATCSIPHAYKRKLSTLSFQCFHTCTERYLPERHCQASVRVIHQTFLGG